MPKTESMAGCPRSTSENGSGEPQLCFPAEPPPRHLTKQQKIVLWSAWGVLITFITVFLFTSVRPFHFIPPLFICALVIIGYTQPINRFVFGPRRQHRHLMHYDIHQSEMNVVIKDKTVRTIRWRDLTAVKSFDEPLKNPAGISFHGGWNQLYWHVREGRAEGLDTLSIHATTVERGVLLKSRKDMEWIAVSPLNRKGFLTACQARLDDGSHPKGSGFYPGQTSDHTEQAPV